MSKPINTENRRYPGNEATNMVDSTEKTTLSRVGSGAKPHLFAIIIAFNIDILYNIFLVF